VGFAHEQYGGSRTDDPHSSVYRAVTRSPLRTVCQGAYQVHTGNSHLSTPFWLQFYIARRICI
jgi:hypothetical protein